MSSRERLLKQFRELVVERLKRISNSVLALESGPSPDSGRQALRELHGLKGEARMMGFGDINTIVHEMEELVRSAEPAGFSLTGGSTDALLVAADAVSVLSGATPPAGAPPEVQKLVEWLKQRTHAEQNLRKTAPAEAPNEPPSPPTLAPTGPGGTVISTGPATRAPSGPPPPVYLAPPSRSNAQTSPPAQPLSPHHTPPPQLTPTPQQPGSSAPQMPGSAAPRGPVAPEKKPGARASDARNEGVRIGVQSLDVLTTAVTNLSQVARRRELAAARRLALARELAALARMAEDLGPQAAEIASRLNRSKEV
ncbi:MAG TPA: Hpt domain-containing protein, partial [Longimicrobium sp.]|nr:Hpt domain-containing protein [Longimicrobium sp.]